MCINAITNGIVLEAKIKLAIKIKRRIYERYLFIYPDKVGEYRFELGTAKNAIIFNSDELGDIIEDLVRDHQDNITRVSQMSIGKN